MFVVDAYSIACLLAKRDHDTDGDYFGFQESTTNVAVSLSLRTNKYELRNASVFGRAPEGHCRSS